MTDKWLWSNDGISVTRETEVLGVNPILVPLPNTNLTWNCVNHTRAPAVKKLATNRLCHGTAIFAPPVSTSACAMAQHYLLLLSVPPPVPWHSPICRSCQYLRLCHGTALFVPPVSISACAMAQPYLPPLSVSPPVPWHSPICRSCQYLRLCHGTALFVAPVSISVCAMAQPYLPLLSVSPVM